jgi:hypothetical protein
MAKHGARVTQAEINVAVAVGVGQVDALGLLNEQREGGSPVHHPMHGHAAQPVPCCIIGMPLGLWVALDKEGLFSCQHGQNLGFRYGSFHDFLGKWTLALVLTGL